MYLLVPLSTCRHTSPTRSKRLLLLCFMCCLSPNAIKHTISVDGEMVSVLTEIVPRVNSCANMLFAEWKIGGTQREVALPSSLTKSSANSLGLPWHPWGDCRHLIFRQNVSSLNAVSRTIGAPTEDAAYANMVASQSRRSNCVSHMACAIALCFRKNTPMLAIRCPKLDLFIIYDFAKAFS